MGRVSNSFKREIGKNAGKAVSNFIFGDSHSTPYRRVDAERRTEIADKKADAEISRNHQADLNVLDTAVLRNVDIVLQTKIPKDEEALTNLLSLWSAQLETISWSFKHEDYEGRIHNKYSNALLSKYKQAVLMMKTIAPNSPMTEFYDNSLEKAKRRKRLSRIIGFFTYPVVWIILILVAVFLFIFIMHLIED